MYEDKNSTLLDLSQKISELSLQIHNHLRKTNQKEPDFSPTTREINPDVDFEVLRSALHEAAQDLQVLVDGPKATLRALYGTHYDLAAHQVALEFDFFSKVPLHGAITVDELAQQTTLDPDIVGRVLRLLATLRVFRESGKDEFSHTALSAVVAQDDDLKASFHMQMDEIFQAAGETAACLRDSGRALESTHCAFSRRFGMSIFEYYNKHPEKGERFGRALAGATKLDRNVNALCEKYDWERLPEGPVVDVGGADGSVSLLLAERWPHLSFIVQDVSPALLSQGASQLPEKHRSRFTFQQHDFFTDQPVSTASLFFIRQCLHNWTDADCVKILRAFVPALENCREGTPLLINESVLSNAGRMPRHEERLVRQVDMSMLINVGARQRTEDDFRRLVKEADERLEIVMVHSIGSMGLLEVQLVRGGRAAGVELETK